MSKRLDAIFDEALERLRRGESVAACLAAYPADAPTLRPLLEAAGRALSMPLPPEPGRAAEGWARLRARLDAVRQRAQVAQSHGGGPFLAGLALPFLALGRLGSPVLRGASLVALATLLGVTGLAAAAAVGQGGFFSPVTGLFGSGGHSAPSSGSDRVEFEGRVTAISGLTLTVELTELEGAGLIGCTDVEVDMAFGEIKGPLGIGSAVKIEGRVTGECQVRADEVETLMVAPSATPTVTLAAADTPTSTPTAVGATVTPTATSTTAAPIPTTTSTPAPVTSEVEFLGRVTAISDLALTVQVLEVEEGNLNGCGSITVDLGTAEKIEGPLTVGSLIEVGGLRTNGCNVEAKKVEAEQPADDEDALDDDEDDGDDEHDGDEVEDEDDQHDEEDEEDHEES